MSDGIRLVTVDPDRTTKDEVARYLPSNFKIIGTTENGRFIVAGRDVAGWTVEDYIIPRLASGLIASETLEV